MNQKKSAYPLLIFLVIILAGIAAYFIIKENKSADDYSSNSENENNGTITPTPASNDFIYYRNDEFGFTLTLPKTWQGYTVTTGSQSVVIRHPDWTEGNPRMDMPILIYPVEQWKKWEADNFESYPTAAPFGPAERGRNRLYVFATAPRYNYSFAAGWEEVEEIIKTLRAF